MSALYQDKLRLLPLTVICRSRQMPHLDIWSWWLRTKPSVFLLVFLPGSKHTDRAQLPVQSVLGSIFLCLFYLWFVAARWNSIFMLFWSFAGAQTRKVWFRIQFSEEILLGPGATGWRSKDINNVILSITGSGILQKYGVFVFVKVFPFSFLVIQVLGIIGELCFDKTEKEGVFLCFGLMF